LFLGQKLIKSVTVCFSGGGRAKLNMVFCVGLCVGKVPLLFCEGSAAFYFVL